MGKDKYKPKKELSAKKALSEHGKLESRWSEESKLSQRILIEILKQLEIQNKPERGYNPLRTPGLYDFSCSNCKGTGYLGRFDTHPTKKKEEAYLIKDCDWCKGTGVIEIEAIDQRKVSKEKDLYFNKIY